MKTFIFILISFAVLSGQTNFQNQLKDFTDTGGKYTVVNDSIYKLIYPDNHTLLVNINAAMSNDNREKVIYIYPQNIDTNLYKDKYKYWQQIRLMGAIERPVIAADLNHDGKKELYGMDFVGSSMPGYLTVFEIYDSSNRYKKTYSYDTSAIFARAVVSFNNDSIYDLFIHHRSINNGIFFRNRTPFELPTTFDFILKLENANQVENIGFGNYDDNNIVDCIFFNRGGISQGVNIGEYNRDSNNIDIFFEQFYDTTGVVGFSIGDFDNDGKTEFVYGTTGGNFHVIENVSVNNYVEVFEANSGIYNAYLHTATDDLDRNGKKEFWVGGQDFTSNITRLYCHESNGDNSYEKVITIEITHVSLMLYYLQADDLDNDGREELILLLGNGIIIFKFTGSPNSHDYSIYYIKGGEKTQIGIFHALTIADLNYDGRKDILLPIEKSSGSTITPVTYMLIDNTPTNHVLDNDTDFTFSLSQNYPNPFNPVTTIRYQIPNSGQVTLKIYDILGREVLELINEYKSAGVYEKEFNASALSSGIYIYELKSNQYRQSKKLILLK